MGCGLVLVCMFLVVVSTEHSNTTNLVITIVHVLVVALIAIVGAWAGARHGAAGPPSP